MSKQFYKTQLPASKPPQPFKPSTSTQKLNKPPRRIPRQQYMTTQYQQSNQQRTRSLRSSRGKASKQDAGHRNGQSSIGGILSGIEYHRRIVSGIDSEQSKYEMVQRFEYAEEGDFGGQDGGGLRQPSSYIQTDTIEQVYPSHTRKSSPKPIQTPSPHPRNPTHPHPAKTTPNFYTQAPNSFPNPPVPSITPISPYSSIPLQLPLQYQQEQANIQLRFREIEQIMGLENENLRRQKDYLLQTIYKMQAREKEYRSEVCFYQRKAVELEQENRVLREKYEKARDFIASGIDKMQQVISKQQSLNTSSMTTSIPTPQSIPQQPNTSSYLLESTPNPITTQIEQLNNQFDALMYEYQKTREPELRKKCMQLAKELRRLRKMEGVRVDLGARVGGGSVGNGSGGGVGVGVGGQVRGIYRGNSSKN